MTGEGGGKGAKRTSKGMEGRRCWALYIILNTFDAVSVAEKVCDTCCNGGEASIGQESVLNSIAPATRRLSADRRPPPH